VRSSGRPSPPSNGIAYYFEGNMTEPEVMDQALEDQTIRFMAEKKLPPPEDTPDAEIWQRSDGTVEGLLWRSGDYRLDGGRVVRATVPAPGGIAGPWRVRFQEGRDAPPEVTLNELISLHRHADPGVRYFSGTATYSRTLDLPVGFVAGDARTVLDLGRVEVIAQVRINGRDLGTLWKEPYRLDVTEALHAGSNELEIRVTNLWPNRIIGDEQLPPENQYATGPEHGILHMPDWYLNGQAKPAGGRITFDTWQFYHKDDPLLESGMLGPVRLLHPVRVVFGK
jgi:hypothetical protein